MASFVYKAKNAATQTVQGRVEAPNQDEAIELVVGLGLVPVSVEEETHSGVLVSSIKSSRVKPKELYAFTKQLSGLVKSSVSLLKAIEIIAAQSRNNYFAHALSEIALGIRSGRSFSSCLADYDHIFSPVYVAMVRVGEEVGNLREILSEMAKYQKRQDELSAKVRNALVYPLVMLSVGAMTVFVILTFVLPKITAIFSSASQQLPWPTLFVMGASHFLKYFWPIIFLGLFIAIYAFNYFKRTTIGQISIGSWLLRLPYINNLVIKSNMVRFSRTMNLLLESQLPLVRAMEIAAPTIQNPQLKADIYLCAESVNAGESFGSSLSRATFVPSLFVQSLTIAEESGSLNEAFADIAESCESELEDAFKTMTALLEPAMILIVGAMVGFIVFAMLLPIFSMDILAR